MSDIQDYIQKLGDDSLSIEEQALALQQIEQSLLESQAKQEETVQTSTDLVIEAVKAIEETVYTQFRELSSSPSMKGPKGDKGLDGKNGKDGLIGRDGRDGKDGKDGVDGIDGEDGRYITDVEIDIDDTLLVTLSDGTNIKTTKEIKGPKGDMGPQGLRGSNGNGVVVGGTTGQVLSKASNTDYDVTWVNASTSVNLASPSAIGNITPNTGAFTYLSTNSTTSTTPVLSFNASNSNIASGASVPNSYLQNMLQNKSGTAGASTNYVLSNDLGTDSSYYGEFGINSSAYSSGTPTDFFSINNGIYFSGHDGDLTVGSGNGYKTYLAWGTAGQNAHVINASGALGLNTNITGTTNFGTAGQVLTSGGSAATPTWATPTTGTVTSVSGTGTVSGINLSGTVTSSGNLTLGGTLDLSSPPTIGNTAPNTGKFTTLESTGTASLGTGSTTYVRAIGDASYPGIYVTGGTNTPLVLQPLGTGALQAQKTDSSATGGNARGTNAVDWQTSRGSATQVASGQQSVIAGGASNSSTGFATFVGAGNSNAAGGNYTFIGAGNSNTANNSSAIVGGISHGATGYFNFIGGGAINTGTSSVAVTTNTATIAVTAGTTLYLTSTNANVKVGQYVQGTGVTNNTYATSTVTTGTAAVMNTSTISGTTLTVGSLASGTIIAGMVLTGTGVTAGTYIVSGAGSSWTVSTSQTVASTTITGTAYTFTISQAATTAAGVTLSFYTPHGVVVGGGNNQATGAYSFIGGGGDAGTAANRNTASGDYSAVVGGKANQASAEASFIGGGGQVNGTTYSNQASGIASVIGGGLGNQAAGQGSVVGGGFSNQANGIYASIIGGTYGSTRSVTGYMAFPACRQPISANAGVSQGALLILARQTTDATATVLASDFNSPTSGNQIILPNNSAYYFKGEVVSGVSQGGNTKGWFIEGVIKRGATAASTAIVGTATVTSNYADTAASAWTLTALADTTNGGLKLTFTGSAPLATTAAASAAGTATITFAAQAAAPYVVGQLITVAGVTPTVFNGTWTVTACTTTTVQFALAGTNGPQTVAGTVTQTIRTVAQVRTTEMTY